MSVTISKWTSPVKDLHIDTGKVRKAGRISTNSTFRVCHPWKLKVIPLTSSSFRRVHKSSSRWISQASHGRDPTFYRFGPDSRTLQQTTQILLVLPIKRRKANYSQLLRLVYWGCRYPHRGRWRPISHSCFNVHPFRFAIPAELEGERRNAEACRAKLDRNICISCFSWPSQIDK